MVARLLSTETLLPSLRTAQGWARRGRKRLDPWSSNTHVRSLDEKLRASMV